MNQFFQVLTTWLAPIVEVIFSWFKTEEAEIIEFFGPLLQQVKNDALKLGSDNLTIGLNILKDAALTAVMAAENAPEGTSKVQYAEQQFLSVLTSEGLQAVNNAEAGAIKAAVAIIQSNPALMNFANTVVNGPKVIQTAPNVTTVILPPDTSAAPSGA